MRKLMKYELRKTLFSKLILLAVTAVAEAAFLAGVFLKWDNGLGAGISVLMLCAMIGIFYIGIESLLVFHRDLNTKQSYMLFLTPKSSWQILGAKVLENGISIFITGLFFAALAAIDVSVAVLYIGGLQEFLDTVSRVTSMFRFEISVSSGDILIVFFSILSSWLMTITTGYLAIVLAATVLAGKRFSGLASFGLYLLITFGESELIGHLPDLGSLLANFGAVIAAGFALTGLIYGLSCWIMERKLSV